MNDKVIKVLHFSSHDEDCGVGKYQEQYLIGMRDMPHVVNKFFDSSPYKTRIMSPAEFQGTLSDLATELKHYDILHIQHEFGLFSTAEFKKMVELAKSMGKKVVVTLHTSPSFAIRPLRPIQGPRSLIRHTLDYKNRMIFTRNHIEPFKQADLLIVHNDLTLASLKQFGISPDKIVKLTHPVYHIPTPPLTTEISDHLQKKKDDVVYCITGFMHRYKGIFDAIKALKYLPDNYKLAIIGGMHPTSDEISIYNKVCDLIDALGLQKRVYITGFIQNDDYMNALINECDVCIYPYDRVYYASVSSGSLNLAFANSKPVIAYPTDSFKEIAALSDGALITTDTFAYYELARELQRINQAKQIELSKAYAKKMAWPKMSEKLVELYINVLR